MDTPSNQLAEIVIKKLISGGLIREGDQKKLQSKFAEGKINQDDWRLAIELATESKETQNE